MLDRMRELIFLQKDLQRQQRMQIHPQVRYYNFLDTDWSSLWFHRFLLSSGLLKKTNKTIAFWSVFGNPKMIEYVKADINIFYSGENVHFGKYQMFADYLLQRPNVQIGLGFDYIEADDYVRFPLWLLYFFNDCFTYEDVAKRCSELNRPYIGNKSKFAAAVSSWDPMGIRSRICDQMESFGHIDYAGKWRHNDDSLKVKFADQKINYLQQYHFNICPENSSSMGYTTEKIWEAIAAGCIPVYWGSCSKPEEGIINSNAVIQWDKEEDKNKIVELLKNPVEMEKFLMQDRLCVTATEIIFKMIDNLDTKLSKLLLSI